MLLRYLKSLIYNSVAELRIHSQIIIDMKRFRFFLLCIACLATFSCTGKTNDDAKADSVGYIVKVGDIAPDFTVKLTNGKDWTLSQHRGKVILLQFTASWCGVCRKEMKEALEPLWKKHENNPDFVFIGIDRDEPLDVVEKFIQQTGVTYPIALDPGAETYVKYAERTSGITRNILIDRNGRIIKLTRLYKPDEFKALADAVEKELEKE